MKLETFFEKLDLFADAPDAVGKMRELVLRLAMQGKLSEPHKTDCPVSELLSAVSMEKARLGFESSTKPTNGSADFSDEGTADEIPTRWTRLRFGDIARHNAGKTLDKGRNRGQLRDYITTSNLYWGFFQLDAVRQMPIEDDELERCTAIKGDLLICEGGEAGRAAVWPHDYEISFQNHVHRARFFAGIDPHFVQRYFENLNATGEIDKYRKGVGISNMSGKALASIPVPLPPLAEQKRIVAKVDEFMALCDRLEAQGQERETRHAALARASLARFAEAPTPANLQFLFHPSYAIAPADLRKSILTLAVQGKLVLQDSNEEPGEVILRRIHSDYLPKKGAIGSSPSGDFAELPFDLPNGWAASRLGSLLDPKRGISYGVIKLGAEPQQGGVFILRCSNVRFRRLDLNGIRKVTEQLSSEYGRTILQGGEVLINVRGTLGGCAVVPPALKGYNIAREVAVIPVHTGIDAGFLLNVIAAPYFQDRVDENLRGIAYEGLNLGLLRDFLIPIPPLAEQRRIVAKVQQLMALVDALETQLAASRATGDKLLEAIVSELTAAKPEIVLEAAA